jgi:NO-binding membrane sensor protein with MHYT domain
MRKFVRIFLLGLAVWGVPFGLGLALFPIVDVESALFDTLMSVAMAFSATTFGYLHLSRCAAPSLDEGLLAGTIWMMMSIALDAPFFLFGPEQMRMDPIDYMDDIALTYLMIPIISAGLGRALGRR